MNHIHKAPIVPQIALTYRCNYNCKECFAKGLEKEFPKDISINNFKKLLEWFKKRDISNIHFVGKEPTQHPEFNKIIDLCEEKKILFAISTNMSFSNDILEKLLNSHFFSTALIHYFNFPNKKASSTKKYFSNLTKFIKKNIFFKMFVMLPVLEKDLQDIKKIAKRFNNSIVWRGSPTLPLFFKKPKSINEIKKDIRLSFKNFFELRKSGIDFEIPDCSPAIPCAFNKKDDFMENLSVLYKQKIGTEDNDYLLSYASRMHINTDLSIFPSPSFFFKTKSILSFENTTEIEDIFRKFYKKWQWDIPLSKECIKCHYFLEKTCQGGSLYYKLHNYYYKKGRVLNICDAI